MNVLSTETLQTEVKTQIAAEIYPVDFKKCVYSFPFSYDKLVRDVIHLNSRGEVSVPFLQKGDLLTVEISPMEIRFPLRLNIVVTDRED